MYAEFVGFSPLQFCPTERRVTRGNLVKRPTHIPASKISLVAARIGASHGSAQRLPSTAIGLPTANTVGAARRIYSVNSSFSL